MVGRMRPMPETWSDVIAEARSALAAGTPVSRERLAARIRSLTAGEATEQALAQLDRVLAVGRAKARLSRPAAPPPPRPSLRSSLRARPTLTANMDVRRQRNGEDYVLAWDREPGVAEWEIRVAERADARSEYVPLRNVTLAGAATSMELSLGDRTVRVHVLGRARGGKLLRRAMIAGLSRANWGERWQKRPSAS